MTKILKTLSIVCCAIFFAGCSTSTISPASQIALDMKIKPECQKIMTYGDFGKEANEPSRRVAMQIFEKILPDADFTSYNVELAEIDVGLKGSENKIAVARGYEFIGGKNTKYQNPTLTVSYIFGDEKQFSDVHNQTIVVHGYRQKRELAMIKKDFSDSIATFKTKEFGPELQFVVRALNGPKNMCVLIKLTDNLDATLISKDEMIKRIENLTKDDLFPLEIVRHKVQEDLRDLKLEFKTSIAKEEGFVDCNLCDHFADRKSHSVHVGIKPNKDVSQLKCVIERPLLTVAGKETVMKLHPEAGAVVCVGSDYTIPGEKLRLSIRDLNGNEIESYDFTPNPIVAKSTVDDASITAVILGDNLYEITGKNLNETILFHSASGGEEMKDYFRDFGKAAFLYAPGVQGLRGGVAQLTFIRQSGEELKLILPWGVQVEHLVMSSLKSYSRL